MKLNERSHFAQERATSYFYPVDSGSIINFCEKKKKDVLTAKKLIIVSTGIEKRINHVCQRKQWGKKNHPKSL